MIHSSVSENKSILFRILSENQIEEIKWAAFDIMENTGFKVLHKDAVKLLKSAGALVNADRVKVPRYIVEECVRTAPKGFTIFDREGNRAMEVEGRKSYYGSSSCAPNTKDVYSGEIREARVSDIVLGAKVVDALPNIDFAMPMGSTQDVPAGTMDLFEFEALVSNTTKPIAFIGYTPEAIEIVCEMASEVIGGLDRLRERPFILSYPEPISPLVFPADVIDKMFISADLGIPQIPAPTVLPGATAPVTLAGAIAQVIAEGLMCVTLIQLRRKGAPCCLGGLIGIMDMATGNLSSASPELSLAMGGQAEVAQSFGLPTWGLAGATDSKTIDAQAGVESAFHIFAQGMAGLNLIHDVGYIDRAMVGSPEMLVLGDETINLVKRFIRGIDVNSETLARDIVEKVGPGGDYLQQSHTFKHFKSELWSPSLMTRKSYDVWKDEGAKDMAQRVKERVHNILDTHEVPILSDKIIDGLDKIKRNGVNKLAKILKGS